MATEIVFVVDEDPEGGFVAHALGEGIHTQADDMASLRRAVRDAVKCHFPRAKTRPKAIRLHLVRDEKKDLTKAVKALHERFFEEAPGRERGKTR